MPARVTTPKRRGLVTLATRQDLVAQLHPTRNSLALGPGRIPAGSHTKLWWACPVAGDHAWEATVYSRTSGSAAAPAPDTRCPSRTPWQPSTRR